LRANPARGGAVLGVAGAERRVDATGRHARVRVAMTAPADNQAVDATLRQIDGGTQPRRARAMVRTWLSMTLSGSRMMPDHAEAVPA
jgi:hypothetical protein